MYAGPQPAVYCGGGGAARVLFGAAQGGTKHHCPAGGAGRADGRGRIGTGKAGPLGGAYACCAVLIGNTVSEAVSCGLMALFTRREPDFRPRTDDPPRGYTSRELWKSCCL